MTTRLVLVVGDGPAGCAAAIAVARAGCRVRMIGRGRVRAAPECVSAGALRLLDWLAPGMVTQAQAWLDPGPGADGARVAIRGHFDEGLRAEAQRAGVDYLRMAAAELDPHAAGGRIVGEPWSCSLHDVGEPIVIDASGVNGWLRRALALAESVDSRPLWLRRGFARLDTELASDDGRAYWRMTNQGWLWIRHAASGHVWTALTATRHGDIPWPQGAAPVGRVWRECRHWRRLQCPAGPGYFVCGDAAGYLDPATGDGLRFALESGLRAGGLAAAVVSAPARASLSAALYADWAEQTWLVGKAVLAETYAGAGLRVD